MKLLSWFLNFSLLFQISYLLFLMLYSFILLVEFKRAFSIYEGVLIGWVFTIFTEEIRQVFMSTATSLRSKIVSYFTDSWNILDVITVVLFTIGMILRFVPDDNSLERRELSSLWISCRSSCAFCTYFQSTNSWVQNLSWSGEW